LSTVWFGSPCTLTQAVGQLKSKSVNTYGCSGILCLPFEAFKARQQISFMFSVMQIKLSFSPTLWTHWMKWPKCLNGQLDRLMALHIDLFASHIYSPRCSHFNYFVLARQLQIDTSVWECVCVHLCREVSASVWYFN